MSFRGGCAGLFGVLVAIGVGTSCAVRVGSGGPTVDSVPISACSLSAPPAAPAPPSSPPAGVVTSGQAVDRETASEHVRVRVRRGWRMPVVDFGATVLKVPSFVGAAGNHRLQDRFMFPPDSLGEAGQPQHFAHHHPDDLFLKSTQSHATTDLAGTSRDGVGHDSVQAERGE